MTDTVRMRHNKAAADITVQWDIRASHRAPKLVAEDDKLADETRKYTGPLTPVLVAPDGPHQFPAWIPKLARHLTAPIGNLGTDGLRSIAPLIDHNDHLPVEAGTLETLLSIF